MSCKAASILITLVIAACTNLCWAQTQQVDIVSTIEKVRADMRAERATIISAEMGFSDSDAGLFWPIYRKYEYDRTTLDDRRVAVIKEYTQKYPNLTDSEAKNMAEEMFDCDARLAALKKEYYKKFNKIMPALTVTKFFQLEHRIDLLMDMKVESVLPPLTGSQHLNDRGPGEDQ